MKSVVLACLLVSVAYGYPMPQIAGVPAPAAAPAGAAVGMGIPGVVPAYSYVPSAQFHSQNELGGYNYGYVSADGQGRNELRGVDGSVVGAYSYVDPSGKPVTVQYSAGPGGFTASGAHLPQPVPLPAANLQATAEHLAAKAAVAAAKPPTVAAAPAPAGIPQATPIFLIQG